MCGINSFNPTAFSINHAVDPGAERTAGLGHQRSVDAPGLEPIGIDEFLFGGVLV